MTWYEDDEEESPFTPESVRRVRPTPLPKPRPSAGAGCLWMLFIPIITGLCIWLLIHILEAMA